MHDQTTAAGPCLLFVAGRRADDYDSVRNWLETSRFSTYEATDVMDAMEEMFDFMGSEIPDVIVLKNSNEAEAFSGVVEDRVFYYSPDKAKPNSINDLRQLSDRLDTFFPVSARSNRASA